MKLRTDIPYVGPDGKFTQAGVAAMEKAFAEIALAARVSDAEVDITALEAIEAINVTNAPGSPPRFFCRAWVNFNGTGTVAIRASGNVASITDNGTGDYTINFTTAMPDTDYAVIVTAGNAGTNPVGNVLVAWANTYATGSIRIGVSDNNTDASADASRINVAIFR